MTCILERNQYIIEGCANGVKTDIRVTYNVNKPEIQTYEYTTDYVTFTNVRPVGRTPGECAVAATPAPDYTALLTAIKNAVESTDLKSDNLALIQASVDGLEALIATGNADRLAILASVNQILTQAQAINANIDQLESLLNSFSALYQAESDQTQVILNNSLTQQTSTNTKLDTLIAEQDKENIFSGVTKFHIGTDNYYTRQERIYDSEIATVVSTVTQYSTDGVTWTTTAPVGTPLIGWYETPVSSTFTTSSPEYYVGDNGPFLGSIVYDQSGTAVNVSTISGNTPSSYTTIHNIEYGYSFTAVTTSGQTLAQFITNNSSDFLVDRVISISISIDDLVNPLVYVTRNGPSKTTLQMGKSIVWGDASTLTLRDRFFTEFNIQSDTELTVAWEQLELI